MAQKRNIILVGPMGAGKSTIGRRLATLLDREFVDSDKEIETRTGVDIPTIFEFEQESGFRDREAAVIEDLTMQDGIVLATGGGAVLRPENRRRMKARGFVIYLRTSVDEQLRRTAHDRNRPLLQTPNPRARLEALLAERDPLYTEIADLVVDTDRGHARALAQRIVKRLRHALGDTL
ncbi:MAG TPA: shikimate kinase AroK [Thioalkalivibrio sp.]|nr:shikimate kinase AroK [Thioalkalivibrio sp.]